MKIFEECNKKFGEHKYAVFRIIVGFLFFSHGAGKILGWWLAEGKTVAALGSFPGWWSGIIELVAGLAILLGFWSRAGAVLGFFCMLVAYIFHAAHFWQGGFDINPVTNGGELALLYLATMLIVMWKGNGKFSLEGAFSKKELF